eukprot:CAMPEP_0202859516 /NCGR_PEP_ID=MMETSP1391-20130828/1591_1 /ASSEMBLY_ACC=CAM_ASM_000867 /TAXON_ID=1034604 /ORGANISM="Chlamydomonas leiostraca, Strain SAG 11-49" /LENGTH=555 /DNA_ID=CAMNT_0049538551 /DNA_START=219 /DNA_END=1883 /DNA_ORIENTATION=+
MRGTVLATSALAMAGVGHANVLVACGTPMLRSMRGHAVVQTQSMSSEATGSDLLDQLVNHEQQGIPKDAGAKGGVFDVGRMHRLLAELGDPHKRWPAVHIAGSKGKGSTAAIISSVLRAAGYKVGTYTSPHLHHIGERMAVNGCALPPADFTALVAAHEGAIRVRVAAEGGALSHFEVTTALAFKHFADSGVCVGVIETGMGGTYDATNVFSADNLGAAVITSLGYEHVEALGGSLASIAAAKAGIMRPGRPVVVSRQVHEASAAVLQGAARDKGCELVQAAQQVVAQHEGYDTVDEPTAYALRERVSLRAGPGGLLPADWSAGPLQLRLVGAHQHDNIATAITTCAKLRSEGWDIPDEAITAGLQAAHMPGRLQMLQTPRPPCAVGARTGAPGTIPPWVVLDGAHSPEAASSLATTLRHAFPDAPLALVVAMASDKEHREVMAGLRHLAPVAAVFTAVPVVGSYHRAAAPGTLAAQWQAAGMLEPDMQTGGKRAPRCRELIQASLTAAYEKAKHELRGHGSRGLLVITGSLHVVAAAQKIEELAEVIARAQHHE